MRSKRLYGDQSLPHAALLRAPAILVSGESPHARAAVRRSDAIDESEMIDMSGRETFGASKHATEQDVLVVRPDQAAGRAASTASALPTRMANPGPWAVTAFATTSFMLGMYNSGLLRAEGASIVIPAAFFYGGLIQIIVGVLEITRGNLFGAVVFGTYGPFWVIYGLIIQFYAGKIPTSSVNESIALFLAVFAVVTFYFLLASLKTDMVLVAVFALIFAGLVLLSVGAGANKVDVTRAGGWVTLAFAVLAWYHAAADMVNTNFGRVVAPLGPLGR
jgi:succinate-acetate transporter protein